MDNDQTFDSRPVAVRSAAAAERLLTVRGLVTVAGPVGLVLISLMFALTVQKEAPIVADGPRTDGLGPIGQLGGAASAVAVDPAGDGSLVVVGIGRRIVAVDVSDGANPVDLGWSDDLSETVRAISIEDGIAWVAAGTVGVVAFDLTNPGALQRLGQIDAEWAIGDVLVQGGVAYMADGARGLRIADVSDPSAPLPVGSVDTPGDAIGVALSPDGRHAYVADWGTGVRVIDVSDPVAPREVANVPTEGDASDVAVHGELLLIADRAAGLRVVDVSDPHAPTVFAVLAVDGTAERIAIDPAAVRPDSEDGDSLYAWVAARDGGVRVIDLSDPSAPRETDALTATTVAWDVAMHGGRVFVADVGAYAPAAPAVGLPSWETTHIWGVESAAPLAEGLSGLRIAEVSSPGRLDALGVYLSPSFIEDAVDVGGLLYLADGYAGIVIADPSDSERPTIVGTLETDGAAHAIFVDSDRAYVADGPGGLVVLDVTDPQVPVPLWSVDTPGEALGVALHAGHAYVADGERGLQVIDLARREIVSVLDTPGYAWDVQIRDGVAWISDRWGGLRVATLMEPAAPREIAGVLESESVVFDVALDGNIAWIAGGPSGVRALDISNPAAPRTIGSLMIDGTAVGLVLDGDAAYLAAGRGGVRVLDILDPSAPREVDGWSVTGVARAPRTSPVGWRTWPPRWVAFNWCE